MLKKDEFIDFILTGPKTILKEETTKSSPALPEGFENFGFDTTAVSKKSETGASFVQRLLIASDFGYPQLVQKESLIRSSDPVARYLPDRASFWPKTASRPYQTLLFEAEMSHKDLLNIPAFRGRKMSHLDIVEDALARMVSEALAGFQKGGEGVTADVRKGRSEETLCIVSVKDERDQEPVRLICFGTQNARTAGLETFHLTEQTKFWDQQLAREHLGLLYERQFKKLASSNWQDAFTTTEERKQAEKLLEVCCKKKPSEKEIQDGVLTLLDIIAKSFGLRCKPGQIRRLQAFDLPSDHDIGIDPEERESKHRGRNPFGGVTLRDEKNRLLGYIVYPLKTKEDASKLRQYLEKNNRFHNVLVVFPEGDETTLELWQGMEQLSGKLRKGKGFEGTAEVVNLLSRFFVVSKAKVRNPVELAQELAFRARYLRRLALKQLEDESKSGPFRDLYNAFKESLVHDQKEAEFADAFSQTLTYGLLTARWVGNDKLIQSGDRFTRQNAFKYLPATSKFLGELFKSALSLKLDEQRGRLYWLVDDIADLLDRIDVKYVFEAGDQNTDVTTDPVIHFYEPFLAAYDKDIKIRRGVFFTPRPVVSYIVRSVHELLQTEVGLKDGLADITTWGEMQLLFPELKIPQIIIPDEKTGKEYKCELNPNTPFVQILDPATGTGTFLVEVIEVIHKTLKSKWQNQNLTESQQIKAWNDYVPKYLLPRLYGYELMMAPYAIAHMKVNMKLAEKGYSFNNDERVRIYLSNSLEPPLEEKGQMKLDHFTDMIAKEAQIVNGIKLNQRYTVIIGNPPYNYESSNTGEFTNQLIAEYYRVEGHPLGERNPRGLQDDFVKFFRMSQCLLNQTGCGVFGFITNNSYLDNPTYRGMRYSLLNSYQGIYILNLNGNLNVPRHGQNIQEDQNVFEIQQGVSIMLSVKSIFKLKRSGLQYLSFVLPRAEKYRLLEDNSLKDPGWINVKPQHPYWLFLPVSFDLSSEYEKYPKVSEIFPVNSVGLYSARDDFCIDMSFDSIMQRVKHFNTMSEQKARDYYKLGEDTTEWQVSLAKDDIKETGISKDNFRTISYRPFDLRYTYYSGQSRGFMCRPRHEVMKHMILPDNIALCFMRRSREGLATNFFVTRNIVDKSILSSADNANIAPLILCISSSELDFGDAFKANLSKEIMDYIKRRVGSVVKNEIDQLKTFFHYLYAVFYSPNYRSRYAEFLKIDFPRLPLSSSNSLFNELSVLGRELVDLHLFESPKLKQYPTRLISQSNQKVEKITYSNNTVWIDKKKTYGFKKISEEIWNFHIGGYQVCEKWLKDRKGQTLSEDDTAHYQKIIVTISETIRIMQEIDKVIEKHGGWPDAFQTKKERTS